MRTSRVLIATGSIALALVARSAAGRVSDGVRICLDNGQSVPAAATTGVGGAFVAFVNGDAVVCQYLTPSGSTFPPNLRCADTLAVVEGFDSLRIPSARLRRTAKGAATSSGRTPDFPPTGTTYSLSTSPAPGPWQADGQSTASN